MSQGYSDWRAVEQAIKSAAGRRSRSGQLTVGDQLVQARFDRFLSRVFANAEGSGWLLKGGTGMLARVADARRTQDVDLASSSAHLDEAVEDLRRRVSEDLGDHLRFELARQIETGHGQNQPGVITRRLSFVCWAGRKRLGEVKVDVVVGPAPTGEVEVRDPASRLDLPRPLPAHPYRLYPLVDQVAEKVCATMTTYGGHASSRVKDLVDLVVVANTQTLRLRPLQVAIATQRVRARLKPFSELVIPDGWDRRYRAMAAATPPAAAVPDVAAATTLMEQFVTPALSPTPVEDSLTWVAASGWSTSIGSSPSAASRQDDGSEQDDSPEGEVWVRPHTRGGLPVTGHWRSSRCTNQ